MIVNKKNTMSQRSEYYFYFMNFNYETRDPNQDMFEVIYSEQLNRDDTEIEINVDLSQIIRDLTT